MNKVEYAGDSGLTELGKNKSISKADVRIHMIGLLEELNAYLGLLKLEEAEPSMIIFLETLQKNNQKVNHYIQDPFAKEAKFDESQILVLEEQIAKWKPSIPKDLEILPGSSKKSALIEITRSVARNTERYLADVDKKFGGDKKIKSYYNRLSDFLYYYARSAESEKSSEKEAKLSNQEIVNAVLSKLNGTTPLNLEIAKRLMEEVEKYAKGRGQNAVIAICGSDGNMIGVHTMDGALLASFDIAMKKAYTAVAVKMSTLDLGKLAQPGGTFYGVQNTDQGRIIIFGGGVPLTKNGSILGGIGISGGTGEDDHEIAMFGLELFQRL